MTKSNQIKYSLILVLGAFIWGLAFVFQSSCSKYIGPYTVNAFRGIIAVIFLTPFSIISLKKEKKTKPIDNKATILGGVLAGIFLLGASIFQQIGISTTSTGKSAFITAFYIVLVPIFAFILFKKKIGFNVLIAIIIALVGMGLLCFDGNFSLAIGDIFLFIGALLFTAQILTIDYFSFRANLFTFSLIQNAVVAIVSSILMFIFEPIVAENLKNSIISLLFLGIFSSGIAYTIQIVTQKHLNPTIASLIMSLESVFSLLCGVIIYTFYKFSDVPQFLTPQEIIGCVIMFIAIILSQLPSSWFQIKKKKKDKGNT